jgi:hypothetical protein
LMCSCISRSSRVPAPKPTQKLPALSAGCKRSESAPQPLISNLLCSSSSSAMHLSLQQYSHFASTVQTLLFSSIAPSPLQYSSLLQRNSPPCSTALHLMQYSTLFCSEALSLSAVPLPLLQYSAFSSAVQLSSFWGATLNLFERAAQDPHLALCNLGNGLPGRRKLQGSKEETGPLDEDLALSPRAAPGIKPHQGGSKAANKAFVL